MLLTKKDLDQLSKLALIEIKKEKEQETLLELENILNFFSDLKKIDTKKVLLSFNGHAKGAKEIDDKRTERIAIDFLQEKGKDIRAPKIF